MLAITIALNKQSLERDRLAIRTVFFREVWRIGNGQTDDTRELAKVLSSCQEPEFLRTAGHILRLSKLPKIAKLPDEREAFLRSNTLLQ